MYQRMKRINAKFLDFEVEFIVFAIVLASSFFAFSAYLVFNKDGIAKIFAAQPCVEDPVTCAADLTEANTSLENQSFQTIELNAFDNESGISDIQVEYKLNGGDIVLVDDTLLDTYGSFISGDYQDDSIVFYVDTLTLILNTEVSTPREGSLVEFRFNVANGAGLIKVTEFANYRIPQGLTGVPDTDPTANLSIDGDLLTLTATDNETLVTNIGMSYSTNGGLSSSGVTTEILNANSTIDSGAVGTETVTITYNLRDISLAVLDPDPNVDDVISFKVDLTNGHGITIESDYQDYSFSAGGGSGVVNEFYMEDGAIARYRKDAFVAVSTPEGTTCDKYITGVEWYIDGIDPLDYGENKRLSGTISVPFSFDDPESWVCNVSSNIDLSEIAFSSAYYSQFSFNYPIHYRVSLSDSSFFPAETEEPVYNTVNLNFVTPYQITFVEGYPNAEDKEIRFNLFDHSNELVTPETLDSITLTSGNTDLNIENMGEYFKADVTSLWENTFAYDTTLNYYIFTTRDEDTFTYPYKQGNNNPFNQPFSVSFEGYLGDKRPISLSLVHFTSDEITMSSNVPEELTNVDYVRIVRIDGVCASDNLPLNHDDGLNVYEQAIDSENRNVSFSDTDFDVNSAYCYAIFYRESGATWNELISFGVTENYITAEFTGIENNLEAPVAYLDIYPEDPTTEKRPIITGTAIDPQGDNIATIQYRIAKQGCCIVVDWTSITSPTDGTYDSSEEAFSFQSGIDIPDGNIVFEVRVTDIYGNIRQPGNHGRELVTINAFDTTPPQIVIYDLPEVLYTSNPKIQFDAVDSDSDLKSNISSAEYSLDESTWVPIDPIDSNFDSDSEKFEIDLENLENGSITVYVRATDASGNQSPSATTSFELQSQDPDLEATKINLNEDFNSSTSSARKLTTAIWGGGRSRLAAMNSLNRNAINTDYVSDKYTLYSGDTDLVRSGFGGFYVNVNPPGQADQFIYVGTDNVAELYDFVDPTNNQQVEEFEAFQYNNREYLAVVHSTGLKIIDTADTPWDTSDDQVADFVGSSYFTGVFGFINLEVIEKPGNSFGVIMMALNPSPAAYYVELAGDFTDINDGDIVTTIPLDIAYGGVTGYIEQPGTNKIWVPSVNGFNLKVWDYGSDIADFGDDVLTEVPVADINDLTWDDAGNAIFATQANGLIRLNTDNSTIQITAPEEFDNFNLGHVYYFHDEQFPLGEQFLVTTRDSGYVYHVYTNNTYDDTFDDQIIKYDVFEGIYPVDDPSLFITDYNTFYMSSTRHGFFRFDMTRDFEDENIALSKISTNQYLYANFIKLEDASVVAYENQYETKPENFIRSLIPNTKAQSIPSNIQIQVTNNGTDWFDIDVGEIVNFPSEDYRIRFRAVLSKVTAGETPIIDDLLLTYSAYKNANEVEVNSFGVNFSAASVCANQNFSLTIQALDVLGNPVSVNGSASLGIRKVGSGSNASGLNATTANLVNGFASLTNIKISTSDFGSYKLVVNYNSTDYVSASAINITSCTNGSGGQSGPTNVAAPTITFTADDYFINSGDEVTLSWNSENATKVEIEGIGVVDLDGTYKITPTKTTTYKIKVTGPGGVIESEISIFVAGSYDELSAETNVNEIYLGEKFKVSWDASGAEYVTISGHTVKFSPVGSLEIIPSEAGDFLLEIIAHYQDGSIQSKILKVRVNKLISVSDNTIESSTEVKILSLVFVGASGTLLGISTFFGGLNRLGIISLMLPKKKKYWGIIYDELESKPIPFATIKVFSDGNMNKVVAQSISDLDGRYGMLLDKAGSYIMVINASGYAKKEFKLKINASSDSLEIAKDVALNRLDSKISIVKRLINYKKPEMYEIVRVLLAIATIIGFSYSLYILFNFFNLINLLIIIFYLVLFALIFGSYYKKISRGVVRDFDTKKGVKSVSVRVYDSTRQLAIALTSLNGAVKLNLAPGIYKLSASKPGYEVVGTKSGSPLISVEVDSKGYFKTDIYIKKIVGAKANTTENPFG